MGNSKIKIIFENELSLKLGTKFIESIIVCNLKSNYTEDEQNKLLDCFEKEGFIK